MKELRLLIVEDDEQDLRRCRRAVNRYKREKNRDTTLVECKTLNEALRRLDNSFDAAIIDLKLADKGDEGNTVIEKIEQLFFRIPVAIFTGNPGSRNDNLNEKIMLIDVFIKGEIRYYQLLDRFWNIYNTGLTRIMGGRGIIEENLTKVFLKNLLPQLETWVSYGQKYLEEDPERTEKALLRYALNHLFQLLEEDDEEYFPEEAYLYPPMSKKITTGSIVREDNQWYVVLSPACDLVIRGNNQFRTDRILFVEVEKENDIVDKALTDIRRMSEGRRKREKLKEKLEEISGNNYTFYHHWLPKANCFPGGFLNFRKLETLNKRDFDERFDQPCIQISPPFVKDIVSRFSSYYARQGQPDIDSEIFVNNYTPQQNEGQ